MPVARRSSARGRRRLAEREISWFLVQIRRATSKCPINWQIELRGINDVTRSKSVHSAADRWRLWNSSRKLVASKSMSTGPVLCGAQLPNDRILLNKVAAAITSMGGDGRTLFAQCRQDEPIVKLCSFCGWDVRCVDFYCERSSVAFGFFFK